MSAPRLFVYRQPTPESNGRIQSLQDEYASVPSFQPVKNPHLTLLGGDSSFRISGGMLDQILKDGPATAERSYPMEVVGVKVLTNMRHMARCFIALMLNNTDGHFSDEHRHYMNMAAHINKRKIALSRNPHVTVGYIQPEFAFAEVMEPAEALVGETLEFDSIGSNVGDIHPKRYGTGPRSFTGTLPEGFTVRTVQPGSLPAGFLSTLKPPTPSN